MAQQLRMGSAPAEDLAAAYNSISRESRVLFCIPWALAFIHAYTHTEIHSLMELKSPSKQVLLTTEPSLQHPDLDFY